MTSPERFRLVEDLFHRALDLPPGERRALLDRESDHDPDLRAEVERLLARADRDGRTDPLADPLAAPRPASVRTGDTIGPYRLVRVVGEGGMGIVFEARQERPVRRRVALKLIRRGMDTDRIVGRFEAERQALALMDHPGIARVLDAGAAEDGRPYFAMEYVDGVPVTRYCEDRGLDTAARLELFAAVCDAVQHAHQKGILHRDLKPSNILVGEVDGHPAPKVIDFGIARAVESDGGARTDLTEAGQFVGTPEYVSPEQAGAAEGDVDTRTDVYSLGVLLYELLVGALPVEPPAPRPSDADEIRRRIREQEVSRPSVRARTAETRRRRDTTPSALARQLRGDLDWITLRALDKDRERRYPSVSELAADVRRHLRHEPVVAGPPSVSYRISKFVRRHRMFVTASAAVALALVFGIAVATTGLVRARQAERVALDEARTSERVVEFLTDLFRVSDPGESRGNTITAREILDRGVAGITAGLEDRPGVRARLLATMGGVYGGLGLYAEARPLLEEAVSLHDGAADDDPGESAAARVGLSTVLREQGEYDEAARVAREALRILEAARGPDDPSLAPALNAAGVALRQKGDLEGALPLYRRALALQEARLGPDHPDLPPSLNNLARLYVTTGELASARPLYERALAILDRTREPDHPDIARVLNNLGTLLYRLGDYDAARPHLERCRALLEGALGPQHPVVATVLVNLGSLERRAGDPTQAKALIERALEISVTALGPNHPDVGTARLNLAGVSTDLGERAEARRQAELSVEILEAALGPDHPDVARALHTLGGLVRDEGDEARGRAMIVRAVDILERSLGTDHEETVRFRGDL